MLTELTAWLKNLVIAIFTALWDFVTDVLIGLFDLVVSAFAAVVAAIPVPDWMAGGLQALWVQLDGGVIYFVTAMGVPQALGVIGAGFAFRFARKVATLFQW